MQSRANRQLKLTRTDAETEEHEHNSSSSRTEEVGQAQCAGIGHSAIHSGWLFAITIADFRVLQNKQGNLWVAAPSRAVQLPAGRGFEYHPVVILSRPLHRVVEDKVLAAFAQWGEAEQSQ
jgi:hypothetical protein